MVFFWKMKKFLITLICLAGFYLACSKIEIVKREDIEINTKSKEESDSLTEENDGTKIEIVVDTTVNVVEHTIVL